MKHSRSIDLIAPFSPAKYGDFAGYEYTTLKTLREWEVLGAKCGKCGNVAWLNKDAVAERYGNQYIKNIGHNLRCRCGNRDGNKVLIGGLPRD